jgi:hypothetical protein
MSEPNVDPVTAWMQIVAILTAAADTPPTRGGAVEPDLHSLALGAQIVASTALALLPADGDGDLENVVLDVLASSTVGDLIRAAGHLAHRYGAAAFPAGSAAVITELENLVAEAEAAP